MKGINNIDWTKLPKELGGQYNLFDENWNKLNDEWNRQREWDELMYPWMNEPPACCKHCSNYGKGACWCTLPLFNPQTERELEERRHYKTITTDHTVVTQEGNTGTTDTWVVPEENYKVTPENDNLARHVTEPAPVVCSFCGAQKKKYRVLAGRLVCKKCYKLTGMQSK